MKGAGLRATSKDLFSELGNLLFYECEEKKRF